MNKSKICHVSTVHRGVEIRIIRKELASLAEAGYDAHAILSATPAEVEEARQLGITIHPLPESQENRRFARMTSKMYTAWKRCREVDADLYHFHDPELIPFGLLLKCFGYRVVMDVHEDLANQILTKHWIPPWARRVVARLSRTAERIGARFFDGVVTATPRQAAFFEDVAKRVVVAHNYPLMHELTPPTSENADDGSQPAAPRPNTHVAYIGAITRIRGINETLQAIEKADVKLLLAGKFRNDKERQEAMSLPGWSRVEDIGWVNRKEVAQILKRSFAGMCILYPTSSHLNSEPIKLFEYMAAGIPGIVSSIPDWVHYVEKHNTGICVDPMDIDAIAQAIITLRDNPEMAAEMGRNGQRAVLEHYNWTPQGEKLKRLYQQILGD